jgi:PAS domain S-box-containing protein
MTAPQSRSVQQLAEVLATLVSSATEAAAIQGAVERIAECFDSEVGAVVRHGDVLASVGFRADGPLPATLIEVAAGRADEVDVPGAGPCRAVVVPVPSESPRQLLLARSGADGFSLEEVSLLRSMGRILANALDMLRLRLVLGASESRFRRIVETANEGIWLLDAEGSTTLANDKIADILGYTPEEMLGLSLFDVLDDAGKAQAVRNLERRRQGISDQLECAYLRKDRSHVWVLVNASPLIDSDGSYIGTLTMISDISQRKRMEDVLSQREQQLAEAQRVAGLGSFEWDLATDSISCSDELYRMLGQDPLGGSAEYAELLSHVHPDDRDAVDSRMRAAAEGSEPYDAEFRIARHGGDALWVRARSEVVRDAGGRPRLVRGTVLDVNTSKLTEEALRETTARFRLLQAMATAANEASCLEEVLQVAVEEICLHTGWVAGHAYLPAGATRDAVVPLAIWHPTDPGSLGALRAASAPGRLEPAAGLSRRVLATRTPAWSAAPPADGCSGLERVAAELGLRGSFAFPVCVGTEVTCILEFFSAAPLDPDDGLLQTIGQVATQLSRVAERQRASNELATARDAAMESSRLKSDFLATMSHEIRTPMNGVIGLTGLLLNTRLDERQRQYAEGVQSAGEALLAIINDILDFSKIEAGKLELEVIDFDLVQVIEEAAGLVAQGAHRKGLELVVSCATDLPSAVRGDPARVRQVLLNLASNAVKFTPEGEVVIRAAVVPGGAEEVSVRFEVVDTGIGIADADRQRLFEPFSQADASTTRRFGGTGLGLVISRRLVAAMGGELGFESVPGRGSTFWFTVPLRRQVGGGAPASPLPPPARGLRVLVVDDNATNRLILRDQLQAWGLHCDLAVDGTGALALLQQARTAGEPYDVALLDACMPGMDGYELARRVSGDPTLERTRLVLLTSATTLGRGGSAGTRIAACLSKPVRLSQLSEALVASPAASRAPTFPTEPPAETRGHVLVVEDNTSNQLVAVGVLRLLGYRADVASDGAEALEALGRADYDAILMDCQMPEMDGYTATGEIRRREGAARHTPVIAMTAGASDADRDRCLGAGMDDFLTKPVKPREIGAALARWVGRGRVVVEDVGPVLDPDVVDELRQLTPDGSLFAQIVDTFLATAPDHLAELLAAVDAGDAATVRQAAHRLRGESSSLGAVELAARCTELEAVAVEDRLDGAASLGVRIDTELGRAAEALRAAVGPRTVSR